MSAQDAAPVRAQTVTMTRPPFWRDVRVLRVVGQIAALVAAYLTGRWLIGNLLTNLDEQGISSDFGVLNQPANFSVRDSGFDGRSPVFPDLLWVGIKNTALASGVGIIIAVILGTLIGIGRLSDNWLVSKLSQFYVETLRNIPPLVIITFFGFALFTFGPFPAFQPNSPPTQLKLPGSESNLLILSKDRWGIPSFATDGTNTGLFWILAALALLIAVGVWIWRTRVNVNTGDPHRRVLFSVGAFVLLTATFFVALGAPYRWSWPAVSESGRIIEGGFATNAGYMSVTVALGLYTASHIAEIIRGSILSVQKGQSEAANALALSGFQRYRFVVLPQAMRVAIPPGINQFLNLTKNTSLATVVGYPDITALIKTSIGNGKPAVQFLVVLMLIYLTFSISISVLMNFVNRRFQLVTR